MGAIDENGKMFLGHAFDLAQGSTTDEPVLYSVRDLTTHAVILGMTGSGKTGLGVIMLEEALLQGIPTMIIDPKGDLSNLLLTFPDLSPNDFEPWVDPESARRRGLDLAEYAAQESEKWRKGLAGSGIDGERIARLRQKAEFTIYTPGSAAGQPVDVLHFFEKPDVDWDDHEEMLRKRISGLASALLGLVGVEADPLQSREHILLVRIVEHVWRAGERLDLPSLIRLLQDPPFQQVGVFDLETFFPQKDRFKLALTLNNLIAAPGFETWQQGTPLDTDTLLWTSDGRPRASIFYLAHLNDAQRLFFIALLLETMRDWLRRQSGTTDLRALVYFDEVFGYFPPYPANPATKTPLLALVKQGRSAGLGVILATQNPVDLDYKGLTNAGTWIVGALRAEQDKDRVLEGLEGAAAEAGAGMDRQQMDRALGALKPRVFILHNIRDGKPSFFHTRWAMSYLCGPLTRRQVRELTGGAAGVAPVAAPRQSASASAAGIGAPAGSSPASQMQAAPSADLRAGLSTTPPPLPPAIRQAFLEPTVTLERAIRMHEDETRERLSVRESQVVYYPRLLGLADVRMLGRTQGVDHQETVARLIEIDERTSFVNWVDGEATVDERDLSIVPRGEGLYGPAPALLTRATDLRGLEKDFSDYLYHNISVKVSYHPKLKLFGQVGEDPGAFRARCEEMVREQLDVERKTKEAAMKKRRATLEQKKRREERELEADEADLAGRRREEVFTIGESAFKLLTGRRASSALSSSSRRRRMTQQAKLGVKESKEEIGSLEEQLAEIDKEWEEQEAEIRSRWADLLEEINEVTINPRRADVMITFFGPAWVPVWRVSLEDGQSRELPARG